jgi:hypothetical protein
MTTSASSLYTPSGDDHLIYEWVKMQGKTQSEVASFFGINQSTVSRIVQRVERWQAHAKARENGRLDPKERLRAQRWLTYERNELILASCLRIAHEMEGFTELSKSTIRRPIDQPSQRSEVRTEGRTIDRHGVAARFLRLAYRINMDQLKLADLFARDGELPAEPLTDAELAAEAHQAALDAAELAAARQCADEVVGWDKVAPAADGPPADSLPTGSSGCSQPGPAGGIDSAADHSPPPAPAPSSMHNPHNEMAQKTNATPAQPCACVLQIRVDKNSVDACITEPDQTASPTEIDSCDHQPAHIELSEIASAPFAAT